MPPSVMPKGVEHLIVFVGLAEVLGLPPSVMPKGVEHLFEVMVSSVMAAMPPSVMPKGVEHLDVLGDALPVGPCPPL